MSDKIRAYLSNHFGPNWEQRLDNPQDREFMVEALYVNRILSLKGIFDLGWMLGYINAEHKHERNRQNEVIPRI